jgi:hypothetical protein
MHCNSLGRARRIFRYVLLTVLLQLNLSYASNEPELDLHSRCGLGDQKAAVPLAGLLQVQLAHQQPRDSFGPGHCVSLSKSGDGSCVVRTECKGKNISDTEVAFVCMNPGLTMPYALHSFGRGSFKVEETFDTRVRCKTCQSVDTAFREGDSMVQNALAALPLSRLPSMSPDDSPALYDPKELAAFVPKEAAVFGPDYCISTFRAPAGTCLIRTRCADSDLSSFNVGLTCLDKSGGYTRYLFGKDTFSKEETFDTLVSCEKCLGVGAESSMSAMHGLIPRKLVEDVGALKVDVQTLNEKIRVLQGGSATSASEGDKKTETALHEDDTSIPTILMGRDRSMQASAELSTLEGLQTVPEMGPVQVVRHRRAPTISELFRRIGGDY